LRKITPYPSRQGEEKRIGDMPIRTPSGAYVLLKQIADVYKTSGRYHVLHRNTQRVQTVTANVSGRDLESFVADASFAPPLAILSHRR
jgi:Cu/Ag efflux pump CusA